MKKLLHNTLLLTLFYSVTCKASQRAILPKPNEAIHNLAGQTLPKPLNEVKTDEELPYTHYLDKIFDINSIFHRLPKDVQYLILSYLPNPFRPFRPTKVRKLTHELLELDNIYPEKIMCISGKELFICTCEGFFFEALDGSNRTEAELFPDDFGYIIPLAVNLNQRMLTVLQGHQLSAIILDNYKIGAINTVDLPETLTCHSSLGYTPNGKIIIGNSKKEVLSWDLTTNTLKKLTPLIPEDQYNNLKLLDRNQISAHPKGINVLFAESEGISLFDIEKREWKTLTNTDLNLSGYPGKIAYNHDGSKLLVEDCTLSFRNRMHTGEVACNKFHVLRLYDMSGHIPNMIGKPILGRNFSSIGFTPDGAFIYIGDTHNTEGLYPKEYGPMLALYSANTQNCLLTLPVTDLCLTDVHKKHLIGIGIDITNKSPLIWETDYSWMALDSFIGKPTSLREYLFLTYLQSIGYYGLTLDRSQGLRQNPTRTKSLLIDVHLTSKELSQLIETYNGFQKPVKEYLRQKYDISIDSETTEEIQ